MITSKLLFEKKRGVFDIYFFKAYVLQNMLRGWMLSFT